MKDPDGTGKSIKDKQRVFSPSLNILDRIASSSEKRKKHGKPPKILQIPTFFYLLDSFQNERGLRREKQDKTGIVLPPMDGRTLRESCDRPFFDSTSDGTDPRQESPLSECDSFLTPVPRTGGKPSPTRDVSPLNMRGPGSYRRVR